MFEPSPELRERKNLEALLSSQAALASAVQAIQQELIRPERKYVYGIQGLADLLHCSKPTAQRIKSSGKIDAAISQFERTLIIDAELAIELLRTRRTSARRS